MGVRIGKNRLRERLAQVDAELVQALDASAEAAAEDMVRLAQRFVVKRSGRLERSIVATPPGEVPPGHASLRSTSKSGWLITAGDTETRYAHLVEFGARPHMAGGMFLGAQHPGAPAQPFFYPAWRITKPAFKKATRKAIREAIRRAKK